MMTMCSVAGCVRRVAARGMCKLHYYRVQRLGHPGPAGLMVAPKGNGSIDNRGYRMLMVGGRRVAEHVLIAERALGKPLPLGAQIHHVNGIPSDNRPGNLVICPDQRYHALLHQRQRALACGNANYRKCPHCGVYDDPKNMAPGGSGKLRHRACFLNYERSRRARAEQSTVTLTY